MKSATRAPLPTSRPSPRPTPGPKLKPESNPGPNPGASLGPKSRPAEEESSDSEPTRNPAPNQGSVKSANGPDPAPVKSDPAPIKSDSAPTKSDPAPAKSDLAPTKSDPVATKADPVPIIVATDPTPAPEPPAILKTVEPSADQPHSTLEPGLPVAVIALPEPLAPSTSVAAEIPVTPPTESTQTESTQDDTRTLVDPGNLVFQLSLDSSEPAPHAPIAPAEQAETAALLSGEEVRSTPQTHAGASEGDSTDQNQQEQAPLPQLLPAGTDGTIASQFGFQTPLSFAAQIPVAKTENAPVAASPRPAENVSTPDLPMAPSVDRVGLTIRGADDQVVRVEINQSGELVQVGVRTGNSDLANELRASVPELMHRLDQQGYESRVSMPSSSYASLAPAVIASAHAGFRSGADTSGYAKSYGNPAPQDELRQQRQRNPQRAWRELASQLQED
jgi:hypothetical protein